MYVHTRNISFSNICMKEGEETNVDRLQFYDEY